MSKVYGLFDTDKEIIGMQRFLNEKLNMQLKPDGNIGKITQSALQTWQANQGISETNERGACYGEQSQAIIKPFCEFKYLTPSDFINCAAVIGIEEAVLRAVTAVEAKQFGFFENGKPIILFERHIFYKQLIKTKGQVVADAIAAANPDICNRSTGGYQGGMIEYKRFDKAITIDSTCALMSASYGLFQIMGFNFAQAGFSSVEEYVKDITISEDKQLLALCNYVKNDKNGTLLKYLQQRMWVSFANEYNGPGYAVNKYDVKMENEYHKVVAYLKNN